MSDEPIWTGPLEEIVLALGKKGHGVVFSYNPMGQWDARITTFEHHCGQTSNYETWCNGRCSFVMGRKTAREAVHDSAVKAGVI